MNADIFPTSASTISLQSFFQPTDNKKQLVNSRQFERVSWYGLENCEFILDLFPGYDGISCSFGRFSFPWPGDLKFEIEGGHELVYCPAGGWIIKAKTELAPSYWLPQLPCLRKIDEFGRILSEQDIKFNKFNIAEDSFSVDIQVSEGFFLDIIVWQIDSADINIIKELGHLLTIEKQLLFVWTSESTYQKPAELYSFLIYGHVYTRSYIWPRNWRICSESDAYSLYVAFSGLEVSTKKNIYALFKRQIICSVIARQADDGAWYHGEWTKYMESHYRFHNGGMLILEAALLEWPDEEVVSHSLCRAAKFISQKTDKIDLGVWFLHDSLEDNLDMMEEMCRVNKSNWIKLPILGKSPTNKLIFNTHVDTLIVLKHYQYITGDNQYDNLLESAFNTAIGMLYLKPAETLYSLSYRLVKLTLLPAEQASKLPLPIRAIKRLTWMYITPNLYRLKNRFPRLVMPGGFIERQLGMGHYDISYHSVNTLDLTRLLRCFPDERLVQIINNAIEAITNSTLLDFWMEKRSRYKALVEWVDALYHLCTLRPDGSLRKLLAEAVIKVDAAGLGLPPAVIGADPEAIADNNQRRPCPSPTEERLRVVNLSHANYSEILIVNSTNECLELEFESAITAQQLSWNVNVGDKLDLVGQSNISIPPGGWAWGKNQ